MFTILHQHKKETGFCKKSPETRLPQHQIYRPSRTHVKQQSWTVCLLRSWQASALRFATLGSGRRYWTYGITQMDASSVHSNRDLQGVLYFLVCGEWFSLGNQGGANPAPQLLQQTLFERRTSPLMIHWHLVIRKLPLCQCCLPLLQCFYWLNFLVPLKINISLISCP